MLRTPTRFFVAFIGLWLGLWLTAPAAEPAVNKTTAVFAGGCFWCMEPPFDVLPGVISTTSGYTGGHKVNPSYKEVSTGGTGHLEALQIVYDPTKISYEKLLEIYWRNVDPLDDGGQFCDRGDTYKTVIFYQNEQQKKLAEQSKATIEKQLKHSIATMIRPATTFYAAEDYHQDYYQKNPIRYKYYRFSCGRDQRLEKLWGKKN